MLSTLSSQLSTAALLAFSCAAPAFAGDFAALCADRAALERVYHAHRLGTKPDFDQAMPRALLERLVRLDLKKEAVLRKRYDVEITPALLAAEVQRIDTTTRAPDVLAEIKAALGHDAARFARTMARPILVERELRRRFDNDDALHADQRRAAEQARARLRAGQPVDGQQAVTWELTPRPAEENAAARNPSYASLPTGDAASKPVQASSRAYTVEATAQLAQTLSSPDQTAAGERKFYFEDLDPELQNVLRVQLQKAGDVSAVIETPAGFLVFAAKEKAATRLSVASLSIPKRSYEMWLDQQPESYP